MVKKTVFVILFLCLIVRSFAQTNIGAIAFQYACRNKAFTEVLKDFEQQTNYRFTYNSAIFNKTTPVTIPAKLYTFEQLLRIVLGNQFSYKILGNQILISEIPTSAPARKNLPTPPKRQVSVEQPHHTIYDTIRVFDTIRIEQIIRKTVIDTQKVVLQTPSPSKRLPQSMFDIGVFTGVMTTLPITTISISPDYKKELKDAEQPSLTHSASVMALYRTPKVLTGIGVSYANVGYEMQFQTQSHSIDPSYTFSDTLWYWQYSKLFTYYKYFSGDSVAIDVFDSTYTYKIVEHPQRIENNTKVSSQLSIHYVSIPCMVGYRFPVYKSWSVEPFVLASMQLLTLRRGSIISPEAQQIWLKNVPFRRVTYTAGIGCLLNYTLSNRFLFSLKGSLAIYPSIYKSTYTSARQSLLCGNLEWGVAYRIPFQ
ncbi:MAG: STN domain-containing protein [Bacteroidales bacterium]|jgi:hypothetical protein|nr:STN domain-containing protein [Bacteroidales bacterium]